MPRQLPLCLVKKLVALLPLSACLILGGCGGGSRYIPGPTSEIEACLRDAGAKIARESSDVAFAAGQSYRAELVSAGLDDSETLSTGSYKVVGGSGWEIYYVVRKGFRPSLDQVVSHPEKAAKVVAYLHPATQATVKAATHCL